MHNRRKVTSTPTEKEVKALKDKSATYKALMDLVLDKRRRRQCDEDTLLVLSKLSKLNPDIYTLWNYRREILLTLYPDIASGGTLRNDPLRDAELGVSTEGLKRNPKSYPAWFHRLWIAQRFEMDMEHEIGLCAEFLRQDQRNFHCWNYRRALHQLSGRSDYLEFEYSTEKIQENFSNYSAFHHRSKFLGSVSMPLPQLMDQEFKIVENAIFTEPDDQSTWWYQQFLLRWAKNACTENDWFRGLLESQLRLVEDLLSIENSRWAMSSAVFIIDMLTSELVVENPELNERRKELLEQLLSIDPSHANRYKYLLLQKNTDMAKGVAI